MAADQYSERAPDLVEKAFRYLPGGMRGNLSYPKDRAVVFARGRGSKNFDASGKEYIDYLMGSGPMVFGHAHSTSQHEFPKLRQGLSAGFASSELFRWMGDPVSQLLLMGTTRLKIPMRLNSLRRF